MSDTAKLVEALTECKCWHERQDKALSKSGRGDADYHWFRHQHREEIERIDAALASLPIDPPAPALWKPIAGKIGLTRDGRKVTGLAEACFGVVKGCVDGKWTTWNADGSFCSNADHPFDLVAEWTEVQG